MTLQNSLQCIHATAPAAATITLFTVPVLWAENQPTGILALILTTPLLVSGALQTARCITGEKPLEFLEAIQEILPGWLTQYGIYISMLLAFPVAAKLQFAPMYHAEGNSLRESFERSWKATKNNAWKLMAANSIILTLGYILMKIPLLGTFTNSILLMSFLGTMHAFFKRPGDGISIPAGPKAPIAPATGAAIPA